MRGSFGTGTTVLTQDLTNRRSVVDLQSLAAGHIETARIETKTVQDRRVNVRDIVRMLDRMKP
jgi:hypothetical protein